MPALVTNLLYSVQSITTPAVPTLPPKSPVNNIPTKSHQDFSACTLQHLGKAYRGWEKVVTSSELEVN